MKKNILIYGLISGAIVSLLMLLSMKYYSFCAGNVDYGNSMLIGYASMLLALSLVFVGVRNYRDNYNGGVISFGKAFKIGILICLVAATIYMIVMNIFYYKFEPDFLQKMSTRVIEQLKASGASAAEIKSKTEEMNSMMEMSKNPLFLIVMSYAEILPVAIGVTLFSALILKRKQRLTN